MTCLPFNHDHMTRCYNAGHTTTLTAAITALTDMAQTRLDANPGDVGGTAIWDAAIWLREHGDELGGEG